MIQAAFLLAAASLAPDHATYDSTFILTSSKAADLRD